MGLPVISLHGTMISLAPLTLAHTEPLAAAGFHPELWQLQPKAITSIEDMRAYVEHALDEQSRGTSLPFVVLHRESGAVIGSTRFMDIAPAHRRVEIGATWYSPRFQRSGANSEAKLLMLTYAFETLNVQKVVLKTETLNAGSRAAIAALGAVEEGVLRSHFLSETGRARDMVYFSILDSEWPDVRERLHVRLATKRRA